MRGVFKRTDNLVRIVGSHLSFVFFSFKGFSEFYATWKTKLIATTQLKMADWALIRIKFKSIASFTLRILQWFYPNFLFVFFFEGGNESARILWDSSTDCSENHAGQDAQKAMQRWLDTNRTLQENWSDSNIQSKSLVRSFDIRHSAAKVGRLR